MYIPSDNNLETLTNAAEKITHLNGSETAKDTYARLELYEIGLATTLENGAHPVIGTTHGTLRAWTVYNAGAFEKLRPHRREFASIIQGDHPAKTPAEYFDIDRHTARMIREARDVITELGGSKNFICAISPETGIAGDELIVIRGRGGFFPPRVAIFDIDKVKYISACESLKG